MNIDARTYSWHFYVIKIEPKRNFEKKLDFENFLLMGEKMQSIFNFSLDLLHKSPKYGKIYSIELAILGTSVILGQRQQLF